MIFFLLIKERTGLNDLLRLQLQLEDAEIVFDNNLKEHYYATLKGKEKLKNRIKNKNNIFYVALNKDKIIVFIDGYVPDDEWWYKEKVAYIDHLCVDIEYRRKGIATKATMLILEYAFLDLGLNKVYLTVDADNERACGLYERVGMTCEGHFREDLLHHGKLIDRKRYAILKENWNCGWRDE